MQVAHGLSHRPPPIDQMYTTVSRPTEAEGASTGKQGGIAVVDTIEISAEAEAARAKTVEAPGPGKSAHSPAHRVRAILAEHAHLADRPFGQIVSALNHGTLDLGPPATDSDGEPDGATEIVPADVAGDEVPATGDVMAATGEETADGGELTVMDDLAAVTSGTSVPDLQTALEIVVQASDVEPDGAISVIAPETTDEEPVATVLAPTLAETTDVEAALLDLIDGTAEA